ncbi:MAG: tRNA pseudouridine(55) synthase TruB [Acidobacteriota bacterium]|nr:tRNA pseudouridine(55) synthase TruB [Acidobacteriota bacterium]
MDGVLVIDKPAGPTSHDVVARMRRALGERRIGHTGTLDPAATGVLPLVVGRATRLAQFLTSATKEYRASVRLGWATDTYDATGQPVDPPAPGVPPVAVTPAQVEAALEGFRGTYDQPPPPFSAKKIGGVRAYELARRQAPVAPAPVPVTVHALELLTCAGDRLELRVVCSAGFYVRTLAHDLGRRLGVGGHLTALRRTRSGAFDETMAVGLEEAERLGPAVAARLTPMDALLPDLPAAVLNASGLRKTDHGSDLGPADLVRRLAPGVTGRCRLVDEAGGLIALAEVRPGSGLLHPSIVLK